MEQKEFWCLSEKSREFDGQAEWLVQVLTQKGLDEVIDFEFLFQQLMNASYTSRLWGAAIVLMGGCSDDAFDYFRGWLIGQGEEVFNMVLKDPEYLADYINEDSHDYEGFPREEKLLFVGLEAYIQIRNGDIEWDDNIYDELLVELDKKGLQPKTDIEFDWEEDNLENLFPILWTRFREEPLG